MRLSDLRAKRSALSHAIEELSARLCAFEDELSKVEAEIAESLESDAMELEQEQRGRDATVIDGINGGDL